MQQIPQNSSNQPIVGRVGANNAGVAAGKGALEVTPVSLSAPTSDLGMTARAFFYSQLSSTKTQSGVPHEPSVRERKISALLAAQEAVEYARVQAKKNNAKNKCPDPEIGEMIQDAFAAIGQTPQTMVRARMWMEAFEVCKDAGLGTMAAQALMGAYADLRNARDDGSVHEEVGERIVWLRVVARELGSLKRTEMVEVLQEANLASYFTNDPLRELGLNAQLALEVRKMQRSPKIRKELKNLAHQTYALLRERARELDPHFGHIALRLQTHAEENWLLRVQPLVHALALKMQFRDAHSI